MAIILLRQNTADFGQFAEDETLDVTLTLEVKSFLEATEDLATEN